MKKIFALLLMALFMGASEYAGAQIEYGAFNATASGSSVATLTDYQCLGVNPANLGWKRNKHNFNLGFFEGGFSIFSEPLEKKNVYKDLIGNSKNFSSKDERTEAIVNFTDTKLLIKFSETLFGISFQKDGIGGFAFTIRNHVFWNSTLNRTASELLFMGYHAPYFDSLAVDQQGDTIGYSTNPELASQLYHPTDISHILYNEYILGYGRNIIDKEKFKFYAGIDIKLLQGYGILNYNSVSPIAVEGYQALSNKYGVKYDEPTPSALTGDGFQTAGLGFGVDIGVAFEIIQKIKIGLALNDIGSIKWDGNVYGGENVNIYEIKTPGINSYDIFNESGGIIADNTNLGKWKGLASKTVQLPMHLRFGASYQALENFAVGGEFFYGFNDDLPGALTEPFYAIGTRYLPLDWVQLSLGFNYGGGFGWNIPIGVTFIPVNKDNVSWEIGFASRDAATWFRQKDPHVSLVFGFLRFSFGTNEVEKRFLDEM
ncbi:MAG: hypothetical protein KKA81_08945 [Bacteroidetes bacterium]|nr:hypothetical protein [Bacteroidota bacterium]